MSTKNSMFSIGQKLNCGIELCGGYVAKDRIIKRFIFFQLGILRAKFFVVNVYP